jgi:catechol 2,3-dioxygenase-like lactoylglutathione lyase family enzyme
MEAAGVPIVKPLVEGPTVTSFRCADPDGYPIEIYAAPE